MRASGHRAGTDRVDADAEGAELDRQRLREPDHTPFRRRIRRAQREAEAARRRRQVGDARIAARLEQRDRALRAQELPGQVDGERALPVGERDVLARGGRTGDARVVDERIEAAEARRHVVEQPAYRGRVGDVAHGLREPCVGRRDGAQRSAVDIADEDLRALAGERTRGGEPDARRPGGDQHTQSGDFQVHDGWRRGGGGRGNDRQ